MTKQLMFEHTVTVDRPIGEVFAYLTDFRLGPTWRSEVIESTTFPAGPARPGMVVREVARVLNRPVMTETIVDSVAAPNRLTFSHLYGPLPVSGEFVLADAASGTTVTYRLSMYLHSNWRMFASYLGTWGDRNLAASLAVLRRNLESPYSRQTRGASIDRMAYVGVTHSPR
jgi:uncharacterized protein YndB with AHSA1/START domain